jgi:outer membrane biosynthesis protein TonB
VHPGTSGEVDLAIAIARDGQVERAWVVSSTFDDDVVSSCLVAVVRQWQFPAAERSTVDQLPSIFTYSIDDSLGPDPGLSRQEISNAIYPQIGAAKACYMEALKRRSDLTGELDLSFTITKEGRVGRAGIAGSTLADDAFRACLLTALRGWVFRKAERPTSVRSYPFQFRSLGGGKVPSP